LGATPVRNTFLISTAVLALSASGALAAPVAPAIPMPIFTWTGCYVGAHVGGDSGNSSWSGIGGSFGTVSYGTSGAIGGGQVGCNYQIQNFVIGAEGELWASGLTGSTSKFIGGEGGGTFGFKTQSPWAGDVAARFGYAMDRTLFFGKVGVAWADYKFTATYQGLGSPDTGSATYTGLLLGVGVEYALDMHWSIKGEYDYINYGGKSIAMYESAPHAGEFDFMPRISNYENIFKIGANYRF
jgi:outer membrane immunogenic protein